MDEQRKVSARAYMESISRRTPQMIKTCNEYRSAEYKKHDELEHRAFREKRLWDRALFKLCIRQKRCCSSQIKSHEWVAATPIFMVLEGRAKALRDRSVAAQTVSPRLAQAIDEAMRDCELVVRYFEAGLESIKTNKSAHGLEGRRYCVELQRVFVPQRQVLELYEGRILKLEDARLQDYALDSRSSRKLRKTTARDVQRIRRKWDRSSTESVFAQRREPPKPWRIIRFMHSSVRSLRPQSPARVAALCLACEEGNAKEVTRLLNAGVHPDGLRRGKIAAPLVCAIRAQHADIVALLLEQGASVHGRAKSFPLLEAVETKNHEIAELLVRKGARINAQSFKNKRYHGASALHRAADLDLPDLVYLLLSQGADYKSTYCDHSQDLHKISALHVAKGQCAKHIHNVSHQDGDYTRAAAKDSRERMPLLWAIERKDWVAISHCNPSGRFASHTANADGNNAMHMLCRLLGQPPLDEELLRVTEQISQMEIASLHKANLEGRTPLAMLAALAAVRREDAASRDEEIFEQCKKMLLDRDHKRDVIAADPYYHIPMFVECFESAAPLSDEELQQRLERARRAEADEARLKTEHDARFEALMAEARAAADVVPRSVRK